MERHVFEGKLRRATRAALDLARQLVSDPLPEVVRYRIVFASGRPDEVDRAEDASFEEAARLQEIDAATVIDTLWRDGRVPEWVNVHADAIGHGFSRVDLYACPRFVADDPPSRDGDDGTPPFQIRGPATAGGSGESDARYSIFEVSTCWTSEQLTEVCAAPGPVLWLDLCGAGFDDDALSHVGKLVALERLRLMRTHVAGAGFAHLQDLEALEFLSADGCETLAALPKLTIDHLELTALPTDVNGLMRLNDATRFLSTLTLDFAGSCDSDATLELPFISRLELRCGDVERLPRLVAPSLKSLTLEAARCDDIAIIDYVLAFPALEVVDLGATPIAPGVIEALRRSLPKLRLLQS